MIRGRANKKRQKRKSARGPLMMLAGLLLASAAIRLGAGAGEALARVSETADVDVSALASAPSQSCQTPPDIAELLNAFAAREARIQSAEASISDRMQALEVADREVSRKLAELRAAEDQLRTTLAYAETAAESDLDRLTKVYESMKPKQAAALFEQMDPNFAAGFLGRMRPEAAAGVMANLSPAAAHSFSVVLAGRNANAPTE